MPFRQLLKSPYQYFKNRNGIFCELKLNLRWEQWSNILIWQLFENLPKIKYLTGQLVQRLRLFYRSKTIFVRLLPLSEEPSEWLFLTVDIFGLSVFSYMPLNVCWFSEWSFQLDKKGKQNWQLLQILLLHVLKFVRRFYSTLFFTLDFGA
jgi:hypothetical protein